MKAHTRLAVGLISVLALSILKAPVASALGGFVVTSDVDKPLSFERTFNYFFLAGGDGNPLKTGSNWETNPLNINKTVNPNTQDLQISVQHINPLGRGPGFTLRFNDVRQLSNQVFVRGQAQQKQHGQDFDLVRATVNSFALGAAPPEATVIVTGEHVAPGKKFVASLHNGTGKILKSAIVQFSYPDNKKGEAIKLLEIPIGGKEENIEPPPQDASLGSPTDYSIQASGSGVTNTTLLFLGEVDGVLTELDLSAATSLFVGSDSFFVPVLNHETLGLFVTVDLVQWLSAPASFMPKLGDTFDIIGGTTTLLPGFLFSTSEISLIPGTGLVNNNPFDGQVSFKGAVIDGRSIVVPEPSSTLSLLALGTLGAASTLKRKLKSSKPSEKETTKVS